MKIIYEKEVITIRSISLTQECVVIVALLLSIGVGIYLITLPPPLDLWSIRIACILLICLTVGLVIFLFRKERVYSAIIDKRAGTLRVRMYRGFSFFGMSREEQFPFGDLHEFVLESFSVSNNPMQYIPKVFIKNHAPFSFGVIPELTARQLQNTLTTSGIPFRLASSEQKRMNRIFYISFFCALLFGIILAAVMVIEIIAKQKAPSSTSLNGEDRQETSFESTSHAQSRAADIARIAELEQSVQQSKRELAKYEDFYSRQLNKVSYSSGQGQTEWIINPSSQTITVPNFYSFRYPKDVTIKPYRDVTLPFAEEEDLTIPDMIIRTGLLLKRGENILDVRDLSYETDGVLLDKDSSTLNAITSNLGLSDCKVVKEYRPHGILSDCIDGDSRSYNAFFGADEFLWFHYEGEKDDWNSVFTSTMFPQ